MARRSLYCFLVLGVCCTPTLNAQWLQSSDSLMSDIRAVVSNSSYLFAGAYAGVYRSSDNGFSWTSVLQNTDVRAMAVIGSDVYAGIFGYGVYRSTDNGAHWIGVDSGLTNHNIKCLLANGSVLFAGANGAVQRSTNNGGYWSPPDTSIAQADINTLAFSGSNIFAGSSANVYLSTNNGSNWTPAGSGFTGSIGALLSLGSHLFAATVTGILRTTDNGQNWNPANSGMAGLQATALALNGSTLFAGTFGGGIFRSTDEGASWTAVNTGLSYFNIDCLYSNGGYLYAGTGGTRASIWRRPLAQILTSVDRGPSEPPHGFWLEQNYPNPFNPSTQISFSLSKEGPVSLRIYDIVGREVATLVNETRKAGRYTEQVNGIQMASGSYIYVLRSSEGQRVGSMMLLK